MRRFKPGIAILAAVCLAVSAAPVLAQAPQPAQSKSPAAPANEALTAQEIADQAEVTAAFADVSKSGLPALDRHVAALQAIVARAPASYPKVEIRGDVALIRADPPELGVLTLTALAMAQGKSMRAVQSPNIYPLACLLLASQANEKKRHDESLRYSDKGLTMQPNNLLLIPEKGFALNQLHRPADALAMYDGALSSGVPMDDKIRAVLLRGKGYALVELDRWDDAKAAYEMSLKADPGNQTALSELQFIANARKGKPKT